LAEQFEQMDDIMAELNEAKERFDQLAAAEEEER
jgi:hypothetical protein